MLRLQIGLIACLAALPLAAQSPAFDQQSTVVELRVLDGRFVCSAVVVEPGLLASAAHCAHAGVPLAEVVTPSGTYLIQAVVHDWPTSDAMWIYAAGVPCPCAPMATEVPVAGEPVVSMGFAYGEPTPAQHGVALAYGLIKDLWMDTGDILSNLKVLTHSAPTAPGMSGGGLFVYRGGKWLLVGVNTAGFPIIRQSAATPLEQFKWRQ